MRVWMETLKEGRYSVAGSYSLGEHLDRFIKSQVASGLYNNESEVVREAMKQFEIRQLKL